MDLLYDKHSCTPRSMSLQPFSSLFFFLSLSLAHSEVQIPVVTYRLVFLLRWQQDRVVIV